jgi:thioesterase domain-containing protein
MLLERVTAAVRDQAAHWRTTPGALLLSAVGIVLARRTGRSDVVCGVTVSGRPPDLRDADATVGSFVNNLPARLTVTRDREIAEWVRDIQRAQGRRQAYAHISVADIHEWSGVPIAGPLFDTLLLLNLTNESDLAWPGIELVADSATLDAAYPFLVSVTVEADRLVFTLVHGTTADFAEELLDNLEAVVAKLAAAEGRTLVGELLPVDRATSSGSASTTPATVHSNGSAPTTSGSATADALLGAWRHVLGIATIGLDDDFFALGGTSLQAAQLFSRVERITGRTLPLSTLLAAGSVRALLAAIDQPVLRTSTLVGIRSSGSEPPLYAIPGIGGNVVGLAALARALGAEQPFFAFESPGLDGREAPLTSIEAIAARYAADIAREEGRPFHLLGLCWGAAVVAEIARRLTAMGRPPVSLSLIDPTSILRETAARSRLETASFLRSRLELYWDEFRDGDWGDRTRMLASKARRAAKVLTGGEERRQSQSELNQFRVIEANKDAVVRYAPAPLEVRARVFITPYRGDGADPRLEWLSLIEPTPEVIPVSGANAGDAIAPGNAGELAETLRVWLRAASDATAGTR